MRKFLIFAAVVGALLTAIPAWAASTFVVPFDVRDGISLMSDVGPIHITSPNYTWRWQRVDLRGVTSFRIAAQGWVCDISEPSCTFKPGRVTVQYSLDNGYTWSCLGPACTFVTLSDEAVPGAVPMVEPLLPSATVTLPSGQRKANILLRPAFDDSFSLHVGRSIASMSVQFYRP